MRVVGGIWKGRAIEAPGGRDTRPTTDRVRESMASSVLSLFDLSLEGVRVLDAFAGSGAFGIEMLSRGAARCTFVDSGRQAARTVQRNLAALKAERSSYSVVCSDAFKAASAFSAKGAAFDLVFLDPPYAMAADDVSRLVDSLIDGGCITMGGVVIYERAAAAASLGCNRLRLSHAKTMGETAIDYFLLGAADES